MPVLNDFRHGRCQYHPPITVSSDFTAHKPMKHFLNFHGCFQSSSSYFVDETILNIDFDRLTSIPCLNQLDRPQFPLFSFNKNDFTYNDGTCLREGRGREEKVNKMLEPLLCNTYLFDTLTFSAKYTPPYFLNGNTIGHYFVQQFFYCS